MPSTTRLELAAAKETIDRLRRQLHDAQQDSLPLRAKVQGMTSDIEGFQRALESLRNERDAYRDHLRALVPLLNGLLASGKI